jgi:hypothetical protein
MDDGTPRGKLIGDVWTRLTDAGGQRAIPLLQRLMKDQFKRETGKLSELTDDELAWLAKIPEQNLKMVAGTLKP